MTDISILDSAEKRKAIDREGMSAALVSFPFQLEKGWELSNNADMGGTPEHPVSILISGMGGSAIGGDIFSDLMAHLGGAAVQVNRSYWLPGNLRDGTLHIGISYSGNTEETITSFSRGLEAGLPSMGISSGGKLEEICREHSLPFIKIPSGEQPRAALGYMLSSLLGIATKLGIHDFSRTIMGAVQAARSAVSAVAPDVPFAENEAKQTAAWIGDATPVIVATPDIYAVAERVKTQFNENSKRFAWLMIMPEANHNDWVPVQLDPTSSGYRALLLESIVDEPLLRRRMGVVGELFEGRMETRCIGHGEGGVLDKMLRLIAAGDMTSYYLALLRGTDPSPVDVLTHLKNTIASRKA